jgi:glutamate-ammonia-ligase adenylyltransferase
LAVDKLVDILPADRKQLEAMARILEYAPGSASRLEEDDLSTTRKARAVYEKLFAQ